MIASASGRSISPDDLGVTLMHEHLFVFDAERRLAHPDRYHDDDILRVVLDQLASAHLAGVRTIVDATVMGLGRHIEMIAAAAEQSEVAIVVSTGCYALELLPPSLRFSGPGSLFGGDDPLVDLMTSDILTGIGRTSIRASLLKCAIGPDGLTPATARVAQAVAAVHHRTGASITTHTHAASRSGLVLLGALEDEGVDPSRVIVGHCGDTVDIEYLDRLASRGAVLGMDTFGMDFLVPFAARVATVAELCQRGHEERMVLSHDFAAHSDWVTRAQTAPLAPRWSFSHIVEDVVPALRAEGVAQEDITTMLCRTPQRMLVG